MTQEREPTGPCVYGHTDTYREVRTGKKRCVECIRIAARVRQERDRLEAIEAYGGACACCGETERYFLAFDHVGGGGYQKRLSGEDHPGKLPRRLKLRGWPRGYRLLCHNCNWAIHVLGVCPHQERAIGMPR